MCRWRAYDTKTARNVAWYNVDIRKLPKMFRKRVSEEVRLLKQVDHPNIIRFDGAWANSDGDSVVFITEIVTSGTLKE